MNGSEATLALMFLVVATAIGIEIRRKLDR